MTMSHVNLHWGSALRISKVSGRSYKVCISGRKNLCPQAEGSASEPRSDLQGKKQSSLRQNCNYPRWQQGSELLWELEQLSSYWENYDDKLLWENLQHTIFLSSSALMEQKFSMILPYTETYWFSLAVVINWSLTSLLHEANVFHLFGMELWDLNKQTLFCMNLNKIKVWVYILFPIFHQ